MPLQSINNNPNKVCLFQFSVSDSQNSNSNACTMYKLTFMFGLFSQCLLLFVAPPKTYDYFNFLFGFFHLLCSSWSAGGLCSSVRCSFVALTKLLHIFLLIPKIRSSNLTRVVPYHAYKHTLLHMPHAFVGAIQIFASYELILSNFTLEMSSVCSFKMPFIIKICTNTPFI